MKQRFDAIIKNATLVVPNKQSESLKCEVLDVGIRDGKTAEIGSAFSWEAPRVYNFKHLHVLPGIIDSQVHFREPGLTHKEDIESGSLQALMGGVTAFFEMPNTKPPTTTVAAIEEKLKIARSKSHVHFGFYGGASTDNIDHLHELELHSHVPGIKLFLGSSTGDLLVSEEKLLVSILKNTSKRLVVHSEFEPRLIERKHLAIEAGHPRAHPVWRDEDSAFLATSMLIRNAAALERKVHVLHITSQKEMEFLKTHKKTATVEVLVNHLLLFAPGCYEKLGTLAQQNPPIREQHHRAALWRGIADGTVDILATDHAPHTLEEKMRAYPDSPSGMPGVQTMVPLMLDQVHQGNLSLIKFVMLASHNPAQIFAVRGKGQISPQFDADYTVVDLKQTHTLSNQKIRGISAWTPYDGWKVTGNVKSTFLLGTEAMTEGQVLAPHQGKGLIFDN